MPTHVERENLKALIGKQVHVTHWVGRPSFLTETTGKVEEVGEASLIVRNKPMSLPGFGPVPTATSVAIDSIETVTTL